MNKLYQDRITKPFVVEFWQQHPAQKPAKDFWSFGYKTLAEAKEIYHAAAAGNFPEYFKGENSKVKTGFDKSVNYVRLVLEIDHDNNVTEVICETEVCRTNEAFEYVEKAKQQARNQPAQTKRRVSSDENKPLFAGNIDGVFCLLWKASEHHFVKPLIEQNLLCITKSFESANNEIWHAYIFESSKGIK